MKNREVQINKKEGTLKAILLWFQSWVKLLEEMDGDVTVV